MAKHEEHGEEDEGEGRRSEIGDRTFWKEKAQRGGCDDVHGSEGNHQSQAASRESELATEAAGADGEDGEAERDDEDEAEEEASHGRESVRSGGLGDGAGPNEPRPPPTQ